MRNLGCFALLIAPSFLASSAVAEPIVFCSEEVGIDVRYQHKGEPPPASDVVLIEPPGLEVNLLIDPVSHRAIIPARDWICFGPSGSVDVQEMTANEKTARDDAATVAEDEAATGLGDRCCVSGPDTVFASGASVFLSIDTEETPFRSRTCRIEAPTKICVKKTGLFSVTSRQLLTGPEGLRHLDLKLGTQVLDYSGDGSLRLSLSDVRVRLNVDDCIRVELVGDPNVTRTAGGNHTCVALVDDR